jgi:Flp pilus assembly protein TadG
MSFRDTSRRRDDADEGGSVETSRAGVRSCRIFRWYRRSRRAVGNEDGSALIEFAVSFGTMMCFVFALMELCLAFYSNSMISEAAREGTRYAIVHGSTCTTSASASCTATSSQMNTYVSGLALPNLGGGTMTVNTTYPDGNESPGSRVLIKVTYVFPIKLPYLATNSLNLSAASEMYILQ